MSRIRSGLGLKRNDDDDSRRARVLTSLAPPSSRIVALDWAWELRERQALLAIIVFIYIYNDHGGLGFRFR